MKRTFLTVENRRKLNSKLMEYITEVINEEEYLNTFEKVREDARRVECYGNRTYLTVELVEEYLRRLPLSTAYITYNIVYMLCNFLGLPEEKTIQDIGKVYKEDMVDLDTFYWKTLAKCIISGK